MKVKYQSQLKIIIKKSKYVYMMMKTHLKNSPIFYLNINGDLVDFNSGDKSLLSA